MAEQVKLIASASARLKYALGYRATRITAASILVASLAAGVVWQYPQIEAKFLEITGLQTPSEVAEAESMAAERAKPDGVIAEASNLAESATGDAVKAERTGLKKAISAARAALNDGLTSDELRSSRAALSRAMSALESAIDAETQKQAEAKKQAEEAAQKAAEEQAAAARPPPPNRLPRPNPGQCQPRRQVGGSHLLVVVHQHPPRPPPLRWQRAR